MTGWHLHYRAVPRVVACESWRLRLLPHDPVGGERRRWEPRQKSLAAGAAPALPATEYRSRIEKFGCGFGIRARSPDRAESDQLVVEAAECEVVWVPRFAWVQTAIVFLHPKAT